ncbi:MAG: glycoside hydrolase family 99-like domain-containing protein [Sedimentisphaerales bacterium]|nr:glycoside hydrolase family 99-like domain-containing protein [Sedimentisphaerales bacterium]
MLQKLISGILLFTLLSGMAGSCLAQDNAIVGAIRWDDWVDKDDYPYKTWSPYLEPEPWHYRHPFFAKLDICKLTMRCDTQEATSQEIAYAKQAGLDYWAYGYYYPGQWEGADRYNYCLYQYLENENKNDINFCIRLGGGNIGSSGIWYDSMIPTLVALFQEPSYQTVADGRPLVYMFSPEEFTGLFASDSQARQALNDLRSAAVAAGCGTPYIACMVWHAPEGAGYVNNQGYDAISAYTHLSWTASDQEYPYSELMAENAGFWNECQTTGKQVIPIVNIGWDNRPQRVDGYSPPGPWYMQPTMTEWKNHLQAAVDWVDNNPEVTDSKAIIIYAWNELAEGGWLVPTRGDGTARIEATGEVLLPE